jgi:glycosyltransferase involved in cell wall biosynthesis
MSSPRILHVIPVVAPYYGGPSTAIWPMLISLHQAGANVELVSTDAAGPNRQWAHGDMPKVDFPIHMVSGKSESPAYLIEWVRANVRQYDVVQTHGLWHRHGSATMGAARAAGVPYVIRTCGMLAPYSWNRRWWKKRPYWWLIERRNVRGAAAFHVTSPGERAEVAEWHLPGSIHEIPLGLDASAFDTPRDDQALRTRCGRAAGDRPIVLFLGRLHPVKGITDCLLPALAKLKSEYFLALVGGPAEDVPGYESDIRATAERLGLSNRIALLGPISGIEKWACYDGAAVTVQPSYTENFGLSVAEAMARGCPVIVTEGVQSRSIVEASNGGWVVPFDPNTLAEAIDNSLSNPGITVGRGLAGREYVRRELGWDRVAQSLIALYDRIANREMEHL